MYYFLFRGSPAIYYAMLLMISIKPWLCTHLSITTVFLNTLLHKESIRAGHVHCTSSYVYTLYIVYVHKLSLLLIYPGHMMLATSTWHWPRRDYLRHSN